MDKSEKKSTNKSTVKVKTVFRCVCGKKRFDGYHDHPHFRRSTENEEGELEQHESLPFHNPEWELSIECPICEKVIGAHSAHDHIQMCFRKHKTSTRNLKNTAYMLQMNYFQKGPPVVQKSFFDVDEDLTPYINGTKMIFSSGESDDETTTDSTTSEHSAEDKADESEDPADEGPVPSDEEREELVAVPGDG
ncbi:uncharacterized protein LOC132196625 [Neocloeon triangulifer]|uniref:uncharacterized protein LOC132196625 n=1 Tax=Neocloeon triangulifer TaxID=2078957 RepID=UPI00286EF0B8|nr:uncharacterized protein LOC132196625 [Neocloeon triangulifer]